VAPGEWRNWAGNQSHQPLTRVQPDTLSGIVDAVEAGRRRRLPVRGAGAGHSCAPLVATPGVHVDMGLYRRLVDVDPGGRWIRVQAGVTLRRLRGALASRGLALEPVGGGEGTVGGALATGAHGTGRAAAGVAAQVTALELVTAAGEVVRCSPHEEPLLFGAALVGLGALGITSEVVLRCQPAVTIEVTEGYQAVEGLPGLFGAHDHVEAYWAPGARRAWVRTGDRTGAPPAGRSWAEVVGGRLVGTRLARRRRYVEGADRAFAPGPTRPHVDTEWALPRESLAPALEALGSVSGGPAPWRWSLPVRVTVAAADDVWLSPSYGRPTAYLAVRCRPGGDQAPLRHAGEVLAALGGRPHWGKLHGFDAERLRPLYPRWDDWQVQRWRLDPEGVFTNAEVRRVLGPPLPGPIPGARGTGIPSEAREKPGA
jgi:FAD/FMN-containing dehydrogenase